eukprot:scaffold114365_cov70-Phaeocystis_antarctica.AAC.3
MPRFAVIKGDVARAIVVVSGADFAGKPSGARQSVLTSAVPGKHALSRAPLPRGGQPRRALAARARASQGDGVRVAVAAPRPMVGVLEVAADWLVSARAPEALAAPYRGQPAVARRGRAAAAAAAAGRRNGHERWQLRRLKASGGTSPHPLAEEWGAGAGCRAGGGAETQRGRGWGARGGASGGL